MYFEIYRQGSAKGSGTQGDVTSGDWRWRLKGANHETIASGEGYVNHADCLHAVLLIRGTSSQTPIRDV